MAWYDEAVFYHIYPLGLTGAPQQNDYGEPVHRLNTLLPWIDHIKKIGCTALYIGPLFESVGHGYETTDYKKLDSRLGTNEDLKHFVAQCHDAGIRVIFDGVFNHTGRDFFAFRDIQQNRENSQYRDWYCNVNFWNNNEYNDGFSYDNWGGYNLMAKLNQNNPAVQNYICDVIRYWVSEFDVDGIRLDAADVLSFDFMKVLRRTANEVKPDFWLMGEVIHGEYTRWVNPDMLHAVTNYTLHKALYSGHNDHNYFEIAHTVKRLYDMGGNNPLGLRLYNFADNHDVERIASKTFNRDHLIPIYVLVYALPGVPSIYYGSEFGIEGKKTYGTDAPLRPALNLDDYANADTANPLTRVIAALGRVRAAVPALSYGNYYERVLTNRQYAFARSLDGVDVIAAVNNDENPVSMNVHAEGSAEYVGAISGQHIQNENGNLSFTLPAAGGEIWIPADLMENETETTDLNAVLAAAREQAAREKAEKEAQEKEAEEKAAAEAKAAAESRVDGENMETESSAEEDSALTSEGDALPASVKTAKRDRSGLSFEEMTVEELQEEVLARLAKNGPVTDQMKRDVSANVYHDSLVNWVKSFR